MTDRNPIVLGEKLRLGVRRYLQAALPINDRHPQLRLEIERALDENQRLMKGPYVEALSDFIKGPSLAALCSGDTPLLHADFAKLAEHERFVFERPLHRHQSEAVQAIVERGENVVVATGTGSGKTECFLYPILDDLLKDADLARPGVRALLIYPLNALANDQLYKRLAPLFAHQFASKKTARKSKRKFSVQSHSFAKNSAGTTSRSNGCSREMRCSPRRRTFS